MIHYVEDDANIRDLAIYALAQAGFEAKGFPDGRAFFQACAQEPPELVLLDIMLPGEDGLSILAELRARSATRHIPVMMLTAKGTEFDKVSALDAGADDYLAKPFGMMEMVSRVRALLRRAQAPSMAPGSKLRCGPLVLDDDRHSVEADGVPVALTLKEYDLLRTLMANRGRVLTRDRLLESVWGWDFAGRTRTVDVHVQTLRQKLAAASPASAALIQTVRGLGYSLEGRK